MTSKYRYEVYVYPNTQAKANDTEEQIECQDYLYGEARTLSEAKALALKASKEGSIYHETLVYDNTGKALFAQIGEYDSDWNYSE